VLGVCSREEGERTGGENGEVVHLQR
jgi:hypothetical protein